MYAHSGTQRDLIRLLRRRLEAADAAKNCRGMRPWAQDLWRSTNRVNKVDLKSFEGDRHCDGSSGRSPDEQPHKKVAVGGLGALPMKLDQ
jgi:hypothetical protein